MHPDRTHAHPEPPVKILKIWFTFNVSNLGAFNVSVPQAFSVP